MQQLHIIVAFASSPKKRSLGPATSPGQGHCTDDRRIAFHFFLYDLFQGPKKYSLEPPGKWKLFPSTATHSLSLRCSSFPDQLSPLFLKNLPKLLEHLTRTSTIQRLVVYSLTLSPLLLVCTAGLYCLMV